MAQSDGYLIKTWEVHCRLCERPALGLRGEKGDAMKELREMGWRTRGQLLICAPCATDTPIGTDISGRP